jgi:hypothetical protein
MANEAPGACYFKEIRGRTLFSSCFRLGILRDPARKSLNSTSVSNLTCNINESHELVMAHSSIAGRNYITCEGTEWQRKRARRVAFCMTRSKID